MLLPSLCYSPPCATSLLVLLPSLRYSLLFLAFPSQCLQSSPPLQAQIFLLNLDWRTQGPLRILGRLWKWKPRLMQDPCPSTMFLASRPYCPHPRSPVFCQLYLPRCHLLLFGLESVLAHLPRPAAPILGSTVTLLPKSLKREPESKQDSKAQPTFHSSLPKSVL